MNGRRCTVISISSSLAGMPMHTVAAPLDELVKIVELKARLRLRTNY
jgi:hypothetical protein